MFIKKLFIVAMKGKSTISHKVGSVSLMVVVSYTEEFEPNDTLHVFGTIHGTLLKDMYVCIFSCNSNSGGN